MPALDIQISLNRLPQLEAASAAAGAQAVAKLAFDVEAAAKQNVAVDTGALKSSISAITADGSDYDANTAVAQGLNPAAQIAPAPVPSSDLEAFVVAPMEYAAYVEYGTIHMAAQPFLTPALEAIDPDLPLQKWLETWEGWT